MPTWADLEKHPLRVALIFGAAEIVHTVLNFRALVNLLKR